MLTSRNAVDESTLGDLKSLLGPKFNQLVATYLNDSKKRMDRLEAALAVNDYLAIKQEAHGLKGSSQNLGAAEFADTCARVEAQASLQQGQGFEQLFATMQQQFAAVCRRLSKERA